MPAYKSNAVNSSGGVFVIGPDPHWLVHDCALDDLSTAGGEVLAD